MQASSSAFVCGLFPAPSAAEAAGGGGKGARAARAANRRTGLTVAAQFMSQLASLMRTINETDVHYVRCIKPNTKNAPRSSNSLTRRCSCCAGVLEAVRISRMAYPNRMPHGGFVETVHAARRQGVGECPRRRGVEAREAPAGDEDALLLCRQLLEKVVEDVSRYQLGRPRSSSAPFCSRRSSSGARPSSGSRRCCCRSVCAGSTAGCAMRGSGRPPSASPPPPGSVPPTCATRGSARRPFSSRRRGAAARGV